MPAHCAETLGLLGSACKGIRWEHIAKQSPRLPFHRGNPTAGQELFFFGLPSDSLKVKTRCAFHSRETITFSNNSISTVSDSCKKGGASLIEVQPSVYGSLNPEALGQCRVA